MIDIPARQTLAQAARALVAGRITNDQFEGRLPDSSDPAIRAIYSAVFWHFYSDLFEHKLVQQHRLGPDARRTAVRCIAFLKSDQAYVWCAHRGWSSLARLVAGLLTLGIAWCFVQDETPSCWPFASDAHLKRAIERAVYLRGVH